MRTILSALLAFLLILPVSAHDWSDVAARVERSLVKVTFANHICAGFVIDAKRHYVMTAYHCIQVEPEEEGVPEEHWLETEQFDVDDVPSRVIARWPLTDLLVVEGGRGKPSLDLRQKGVRKGLPVAVVGFAYGLPTTTLLTGVIAAPGANWGRDGSWLTLDFRTVGGMSGGPVFDAEGRVVGVMQRTDGITSISRPFSVISELSRKFWD